MTDMYVQEPLTNGRVLIKTTKGEINVELWSRECPKTCRNFIQLCMEGYYKGCIFHRIVKDFMVQTGDPTRSGTGGESIYGGPFVDEFNSRLKFRYRGLLGMANTGSRNTNNSQFFITLSKQDALNGHNTMFGKIVGDSIYTVNGIADVDVDKNDFPTDIVPPTIISCQVIDNPFPDIVPRAILKVVIPEPVARSRRIAPVRTGLLSFEDDLDEVPVSKLAPDSPIKYHHVDPHHEEGVRHSGLHSESGHIKEVPMEMNDIVSKSVQDELAALEAELFPKSKSEEITAPSKLETLRQKFFKKTKETEHFDEDEDRLFKKMKQWGKKSDDWLAGKGIKFAVDSKRAFDKDG